jgi:hypothetical protein
MNYSRGKPARYSTQIGKSKGGIMTRNKTLLAVLGGCAVLLVLCLCVGVAGAIYFDAPTQISRVLGLSTQKPLPILPGAKPTVVGTVVSPTRGASSSATSSAAPSAGGSILDALNKNKTATKFQMEMAMLIGSTTAGQYKEESFMDLKGKVDGKNMQMTTKSALFAMFSGGGELEIIQADGKTYMRGIKLATLTDPKVWYVQKGSTADFGDLTSPNLYGDVTKDAKPGDFKKTGTDTVDNQLCDVYLYDTKALSGTDLLGGLGSVVPGQDDLGVADKSQITFALCRDGYVHRANIEYAGHNTKNVNEKGTVKINIHLWDHNNSTIVVTAPADAKPMPGQ